ncbi:MAG: ABC transporter permease [Thermomicrobiales bacterium]|nr:ABC transporter permease [Thermomicrobiales bacterium]
MQIPLSSDVSTNVTLANQRIIRTPFQVFRRRLRASTMTLTGVAMVLAVIVLAIIGPYVAPEDPNEMNLGNRFMAPGREHWFGTDDFGRDMLSRVLHGGRESLMVGIISIAIALVIGVVVGLVSGYFGGWFDMVVQRCIEVMLAFPDLLLAMAIVSILGPSLRNVMIAIGIGGVPGNARFMRGLVLAQREREFVDAAIVSGAGHGRIIFRYILPNSISPMIVLTFMGVAGAILAGSALSFIGMGAQPPSPEWGAMLNQGRQYLRTEWWIGTFPGIVLVFTALGFNLLGDGLRDVLDPSVGN